MEVEEPTASATTGSACLPRVRSRRCRPGAEYDYDGDTDTLGTTPRSTHTDTDAAADLETLRVGTPRPEERCVVAPFNRPTGPPGLIPPTNAVAVFSESVGHAAAKLISAQLFRRFQDASTIERERLAQPEAVSDDVEGALWERIRQRRLAQTQALKDQAVTDTARRGSVFQCLEYCPDSPTEGGRFQTRPAMTPKKVEKIEMGRQPERASESTERQSGCSKSAQKRRSQSRGRDQVDTKKGKMEAGDMGDKMRKVKVGIDWP